MKRRSRRHKSLVPLSREHHYALVLCLRIHKGLHEHHTDREWIQTKAGHAIEFFDTELVVHFQAEERILFPEMRHMAGAREVIEEVLAEHRRIERLVNQLRSHKGRALVSTLTEFADTLEAHIRKEERTLFPVYEREASPETTARVERGIFGLIGSASRPRHPELLK
ncbi:MAG: hemerythrin domain-containing protein [Acidobacteriia bacterium]|nr:hemerythrin domain-containing protein [Terriglobia bacterium]